LTEENVETKPRGPMPKSSYVEFTLPEDEWKKLRQWLDDHDIIEFATGNKLKVYLINSTQLEKWYEEP
jgi:hypothetical protein